MLLFKKVDLFCRQAVGEGSGARAAAALPCSGCVAAMLDEAARSQEGVNTSDKK